MESNMGTRFGDRIRQAMAAARITQKDIAYEIAVHPSTIAAWKRRNSAPNSANVKLVAEALGVSVEDLS